MQMSDAPLNANSAMRRKGTLKVVAIYAVFACLWILLSDKAVELLFVTPSQITTVATLKGWFFVAVTSAILYALVYNLLANAHKHAELEREAREESLRTSKLLQAIVDNSADAIYAKRHDGRYLLVNKAFELATGARSSEVLYLTDKELIPPLQAARIAENDQEVLRTGSLHTFEEHITTPQGDRVYLSTKGPLPDASGRIIGLFGISHDITERSKAEEEIRTSERNFRNFFKKNTSVMLIIEPQSGKLLDVNEAAVSFYGYPYAQLLKMNISDINRLPPAEIGAARISAAKGTRQTFYFPHRLATGEIKEVEIHTTPIEMNNQRVLLSIVHDISERKKAETALAESEERLRMAFDAASLGWFDMNLMTGEINVGAEYERLLGYEPNTLNATISAWLDNVHTEDRTSLVGAFNDYLKKGGVFTHEYRHQAKNGQWKWIRTIGKIVAVDKDNHPLRMVGINADISTQKEMAAKIHELAFIDPLTQLPNRRLFSDRINRAMATSKRTGLYCALMFIDLDNFKPLNDLHGHEIGDQLLIEVANRLKQCIRETDTVARFGGDEFVVIIGELDQGIEASAQTAHTIAEKISSKLNEIYELRAPNSALNVASPMPFIRHHCSASIGIALFKENAATQNQIIKWADHAMYEAKEAGGNTIRFYAGNPQIPIELAATQ